MARKTFVSYNYGDVVKGCPNNLRDKILDKLGNNACFYRGDSGYASAMSAPSSPETREKVARMIQTTSVTVVILSPDMRRNSWMDWELYYSLTAIPREDGTRSSNGVVCVVQKQASTGFGSDGYFWMRDWAGEWDMNKCFELIHQNRNNKKRFSAYWLSQNYIDIVTEEAFLKEPAKYIEAAYEKAHSGEYFLNRRGSIWLNL